MQKASMQTAILKMRMPLLMSAGGGGSGQMGSVQKAPQSMEATPTVAVLMVQMASMAVMVEQVKRIGDMTVQGVAAMLKNTSDDLQG